VPPKYLDIQCVGMRHRVTPSTLRDMEALCPLKVKFSREPENIHDANAIRVICNEKPWRDMHIGYVSRQTAAEISPRLDTGRIELVGGYLNNVNDGNGSGDMKVEFKKPAR